MQPTYRPLFDHRKICLVLSILALILSAVACTSGDDGVAAAGATESGRVQATLTTAEDQIDDAILHFEAKARLLDELGWAAIGIDVDSMNGHLVLSGEVPTRADRELAEEIVRSVDGVESVESLLTLEGETTATTRVAEAEHEVRDALLETRLKAHLLEEIGRHALDIEIEAADGVVTLRGELDNEAHEKLALETASRTVGVKRVINLLRA